MRTTTLCYIHAGGRTLLLHRTKKRADPNAGKWIGIGGGVEPGETVEECLLREVREETGLTLTEYVARGLVHFRSDSAPDEDMYLFTATGFTGEMTVCDEGELRWIPDEDVPDMPTWEGDRVFLGMLEEGEKWFEVTLRYEGGKAGRSNPELTLR
ncbi:MAG: 8-oxo-dGTP diphosphatase, partial [Clostridiales bacterium]|nr:8-oxo-dGTP diphosphatase [Clostridiales bacterium]